MEQYNIDKIDFVIYFNIKIHLNIQGNYLINVKIIQNKFLYFVSLFFI